MLAGVALPSVPASFGTSDQAATPGGWRGPAQALGTLLAARRPRMRPTAPPPTAARDMVNAELTNILQQVTAQMASDPEWFTTLRADM